MNSFTKKFLAFCFIVVVGGYAAYSILLPTYHIRYRLSLDVEVDGKVQTSSSVVEISYQIMPDSFESLGGAGQAFGGEMHGAALTLDLGSRGLVFVLNMRPLGTAPIQNGSCELIRPNGVPLWALPLVTYGFPERDLPSSMAGHLAQLRLKKGAVDVPVEILPMFVRFRDISDPHTIEELDPRDLAAAFGKDIRLRGAKLELTPEPITPIPMVWPRWLLEARGTITKFRPGCIMLREAINRDFFIGD